MFARHSRDQTLAQSEPFIHSSSFRKGTSRPASWTRSVRSMRMDPGSTHDRTAEELPRMRCAPSLVMPHPSSSGVDTRLAASKRSMG